MKLGPIIAISALTTMTVGAFQNCARNVGFETAEQTVAKTINQASNSFEFDASQIPITTGTTTNTTTPSQPYVNTGSSSVPVSGGSNSQPTSNQVRELSYEEVKSKLFTDLSISSSTGEVTESGVALGLPGEAFLMRATILGVDPKILTYDWTISTSKNAAYRKYFSNKNMTSDVSQVNGLQVESGFSWGFITDDPNFVMGHGFETRQLNVYYKGRFVSSSKPVSYVIAKTCVFNSNANQLPRSGRLTVSSSDGKIYSSIGLMMKGKNAPWHSALSIQSANSSSASLGLASLTDGEYQWRAGGVSADGTWCYSRKNDFIVGEIPTGDAALTASQIHAALNDMFKSYLGREIDSGALNYYRPLVMSGAKKLVEIQEEIAASDEGFIVYAYKTYLRRAPDSGGLNYYMGELPKWTASMGKAKAREKLILTFQDQCKNNPYECK